MEANHPRFLFHGTNGKYEREQRLKNGVYRHDNFGAVQLTKSSQWATIKAVASMYTYQTFGIEGGAVVLIIDTRKLITQIEDYQYPPGVVPVERKWLVAEMNPDAYEIISVIEGFNDKIKRRIESAMKKII